VIEAPQSPPLTGRKAAARRGLPAGAVARLGMPLFWLLLTCFILAPCACFLLLAVSPRLFSQGDQWFTLTYLRQALTGATAVAIVNSLWVSCAAAGLGVAIGFPMAWLAARTTLPGRHLVFPAMWLVVLLPSWLPALGWERIVEPDGVMYRLGLDWPWVTHLILGPFGVVLLLGLRCVPFSYLAITAALAGLGQEYEDAARVHGASRSQAMRLIIPILGPAIWSALAIGFAESISDFGVAATLAYTANFPLATYQLYAAIGNFPPNFPLADFGVGMAQAVLAVAVALAAVGAVLGGYRLLAPAGWRRIGSMAGVRDG
jgi:iron(III) transport system permease protein